MTDLKARIIEKVTTGELKKEFAFELIKGLQSKVKKDQDVAIIGMAGKFPGAKDIDEFWSLLSNEICSIGTFPETRRKDTDHYLSAEQMNSEQDPYLKGGYLDEIDKFDAQFFRISPKEAQLMDPHQRLFLETAVQAIEDAGYGGTALDGTKTGIYVGRDLSEGSIYKEMISEANPLAITGLATSILASRLAYVLNLKGPAMILDTACSSSLVAVHLACQSLKDGDCDLAIAGGISLSLRPVQQVGVGVDSPDATVRAFDRKANGTVWGEGVGILLLKSLEKAIQDKDRIYAVIKGSAINNDGASNGITAPSAESQESVILRAWKEAKIHPETLSYIEAHGTGTQLGDPIELKGLEKAFKQFTDKKSFCSIGSLKPNIGHLVGASGIASLMKVVLALQNKMIPASLNFTEPNPYINFVDSALMVNDKSTLWESSKDPRRAGVTSLGFSGTNCHLVVEEVTDLDARVNEKKLDVNILTLSANSEKGLKELAVNYQRFVADRKHTDLKIDGLCYTANTGRGHYQYRLALIVKDIEELSQKLDLIIKLGDVSSLSREEGIYYGEHKVVGYRDSMSKNEISEDQKIQLTKDAAQIIEKYMDIEKKEEVLKQLAELYIAGADIKWNGIYLGYDVHKTKIPTYPFDRKRHWVIDSVHKDYNKDFARKNDGVLISGNLVGQGVGSLFDASLEMINQKVYLTEFSVDRHWVLKEHRIMGRCIVPGTTYLEMMMEVVNEDKHEQMVQIENVTFLNALMVRDDEIKVAQTIIEEENTDLNVTIMTKKGKDQSWKKHAWGKITFFELEEPETYDITEITGRCTIEKEIPEENYDIKGIYEMGPRWRNIRKVYIGSGEVLGYLSLDESYADDLNSYHIHPSLMDMAVGVASQLVDNSREYLPFSYKKIKVYGSLPSSFYSYAKKLEDQDQTGETVAFDLIIIDEEGKVILKIDEYKIKKVSSSVRKEFYHEIHWTAEKVKTKGSIKDGELLIFNDRLGVSDRVIAELKTKGCKVVEVTIGDSYQKFSAESYRISNDQEDYRLLVQDVFKNREITKILHMSALNSKDGVNTYEELQIAQEVGAMSLFYLTKELANHQLKHEVDLLIVTDYLNEVTRKEELLKPEHAPLVGLAKVIRQEMPKINSKILDIDHGLDLKVILDEFKDMKSAYQVAIRDGLRYVEELTQIEILEKKDRKIEFKENGVYVVTGGLGGLGLEVAKSLSKKTNLRFVMINRTPIPVKDHWEEILSKGVETKVIKKIEGIKEIEKNGSKVFCHFADVANLEEMQKIMDTVRTEYGRINGVIHAAGLGSEGLLVNTDVESFKNVLSPKVTGTWVLNQVTKGDSLDFFIMFSSINAIFGGPGQGSYAAANLYMDSFAALRNKKGQRTISINWPAWRETGMAVDFGVNLEGGVFKALSVKDGMSIFTEVLYKDIYRILAGEMNYDLMAKLSGDVPVKLSKVIQFRIENKRTMAIFEVKIKEDEKLLSDVHKRVAKIWAQALGLEEISVHDDFYELGGDSIIGVTIATNLSKEFNAEFPLEEIFRNPTVDGISKIVPNYLANISSIKFKKVARRRKEY